MRLTVYQVKEDMTSNPNYVGTLAILDHCMIPYDVVVDLPQTMRKAQGKINPSCGFVVDVPKQLAPNGVITDCVKLALWINANGFVPI